MRLLGQLGDVDVVADLVDRMGEDDAQARENAIELLENIGNRELLEPLLPLLIDDEEEQSQRAWALSGWRATGSGSCPGARAGRAGPMDEDGGGMDRVSSGAQPRTEQNERR